ncbi:hypothetical protein [Streptomonospora arabica]|uniref:Transglutaminase-like domain-containing protein n=1 Tax=Streptomonospora arabica TaxID=412417 RepID=A0ABV9SGF2_9ACTN
MGRPVTTSEEVRDLFNVTANAKHKYDTWSTGHRRADVVPHVLAHTTRVLYTLTRDDLERVRCPSGEDEHALGRVKRAQAESVADIVDWEPDFAFTHVFHHALETLGHLPTWQEFRRFCENDPVARRALWLPAQAKIAEVQDSHGTTSAVAHDAMRWRVGNAYYSSVREIHLITLLRIHGIDVRFHPLADALFRVDAWWGHTVLSIYVGNDRFRNAGRGRKEPPERILHGAAPSFAFETINLAPADRYGVVHLAAEKDIQAVAERLKANPGPEPP